MVEKVRQLLECVQLFPFWKMLIYVAIIDTFRRQVEIVADCIHFLISVNDSSQNCCDTFCRLSRLSTDILYHRSRWLSKKNK